MPVALPLCLNQLSPETGAENFIHKNYWYGTSNFAGQYLYATAFEDPGNVVVGFSYRFGNNKVKAAREHTTGIDEESRRAGSSGNS